MTGPKGYARHVYYPDDRCLCGHIVYVPGDPCLAAVAYDPPRCNCTDHRIPVKAPGGDAA